MGRLEDSILEEDDDSSRHDLKIIGEAVDRLESGSLLELIGAAGGIRNFAGIMLAKIRGREIRYREKLFERQPYLDHNTMLLLLMNLDFRGKNDSMPYYLWTFTENCIRQERAERRTERQDNESIEAFVDAIVQKDLEALANHDFWRCLHEYDMPASLDLLTAYANILHATGNKERAEGWWELALWGQVTLFEDRFRKVGESRNEVLVFDTELQVLTPPYCRGIYLRENHVMRNFFVKRSAGGGNISEEFDTTSRFFSVLGNLVAQPVAMTTVAGREYLATKTAGAETLTRALPKLSKRQRTKKLEEAAKLLARIHAAAQGLEARGELRLADVAKDNQDYYLRRIEDILFHYDDKDATITVEEQDRQTIRENYDAITRGLDRLPTEYYKDHTLQNIVVNYFGELVAIDFEGKKKLPPQIDLVTLLEFGAEYINDRQRRKIISTYLQEKEKLTGRMQDFEAFMQAYPCAAVQRHLELIGYRSRDVVGVIESGQTERIDEEFQRRNYHLEKAEEHIKKLTSSTKDDEQRKKLERLYAALQNIRIDLPQPKV